MKKRLVPFAVLLVILSVILSASAQNKLPDIGITGNLALGVVKTVGPDRIVLETKDGLLEVILLAATSYKLLPPDDLSLAAAKESSLDQVSVGDRVLVTGKVSDDKTSIRTKTLFLVKKEDIKAKRNAERREWQRRGITGRVKTVNPTNQEISIEMRGLTGKATLVKVSPKVKVTYLRYAHDSVRYDDAKPSSFAEIAEGDMLRALGDRSEDQTTFKAEQILSGAFLTVAGTVKSIDPEKNEVVISNLKTKQDVTISVNADSLLKKFPEEIAKRLAMAQVMAARGAGQTAGNKGDVTKSNSSTTPETKPPADRSSRPRGGGEGGGGQRGQRGGQGGGAQGQRGQGRGGRGGGDINQMLNGFPSINVSDLAVGDLIAVSSPKGIDPTKLTAIKLLAGIEPFLQAQQAIAARSGGKPRRGVNTGVSIPGLDGLDF